jgi:hypothetical protein
MAESRQRAKVELACRKDVLAHGGGVHVPRRNRRQRQPAGKLRQYPLRRGTQHARLRQPVAEQQIRHLPSRMVGNPLEQHGSASLDDKRAEVLARHRVCDP